MRSSQTALALLLVAGAATACGGGTSTNVGTGEAALRRAKDCGDLLTELQNDALLKLEKAASRQIQLVRACQAVNGASSESCAYVGYGYGGGAGVDFAADSGGRGESAPTAQPSAPSSGANGSSSGGSSSSGGATSGAGSVGTADPSRTYTDTNTQVKGVDEADIVKTDGTHLFVLHGSQLKVVRAYPSDGMSELAQIAVEGSPLEMYVADGKAVIYSRVNGGALFQAAGITPKASYSDYGYGGGGGFAEPAEAPSRTTTDPGGTTGSGGATTVAPYVAMTKVTVVALTATGGTVQRESYFEGNYLSSRRVDAHVRTVLQGGAHGPRLKYSLNDGSSTNAPSYPKTGDEAIAQIAQLRDANRAIIRATQLSDWMPVTFTKDGASVVASSASCSDAYVPTAGSTAFGLTEVATIDLGNPTGLPRETAIFGQADTVYASTDALYLAGRGYVDFPGGGWGFSGGGGDVAVGVSAGAATPPPVAVSPTPASDPSSSSSGGGGSFGQARPSNVALRNEPATAASPSIPANLTHVHKLDLTADPSFPTYVGSGTVAGSVNDQFALDERDGKLRIATTENRIYLDELDWLENPTSTMPRTESRERSFTHVTVLERRGSSLATVGQVRDLAPGERIYSTRFVGPRGYVVTFRQVDPLFVIDLAQPSTPKVLGELKIPGFSEYMHPIDDGHLLTIGREASAEGRVQGIALQVFDVTDGRNPKQLHKFVYTGSEYGSSEASQNHKAFTYYPEKKLLAFPYTTYQSSPNGGGPRSTLELFHVDLASGFSKIGALDHSAFASTQPGKCGYSYSHDPSVRRGLFIENVVYSVSYGGIVAKQLNLLGAPGASLPFGAPVFDQGGSSGGSAGAPMPDCTEPAPAPTPAF